MRPYGYEADKLTPRDPEAQHVRTAAQAVLDGDSLRSIARQLNEQGVRTVTGRSWAPLTMRRVLTSPRIAGLHTNGTPAPWPPILDADLWEKVRAALSERNSTGGDSGPPERRTYLLTGGLAVCALCGQPLISRPSNAGRRGYVCRSGPPSYGCGRIRINADGLEDHVAAHLLARLAAPGNAQRLRRLVQTETARLRELIERDETFLTTLGADHADGHVTREAFRAANQRVRDRLRDNRRELDRLADTEQLPLFDGDDLADWWNRASIDRRRALAAVLLERVEVGPAIVRGSRQFEDARVRLVWR